MATVGLVGFVFSKVELREVGARLSRMGPVDAVWVWGAFGLSFLVAAHRMRTFISLFGGRLGLGSNFRIFLLGHGYNFFLPGISGGDAVMMMQVYRSVERGKALAAAAVLCDRFIGFFSLGLMTALLLGLFLIGGLSGVESFGIVALGVSYILLLSILGPGVEWFFRLSARFKSSRVRWKRGVRALALIFLRLGRSRKRYTILGLSLLNHLIYFALCLGILRVVGVEWGYWAVSLSIGLVFLATCLPISIGGHGVREIAFSQCLIFLGGFAHGPETFEIVTSFSILLFGFSAIWAVTGLLAGLLSGGGADAEEKQVESLGRTKVNSGDDDSFAS